MSGPPRGEGAAEGPPASSSGGAPPGVEVDPSPIRREVAHRAVHPCVPAPVPPPNPLTPIHPH